MKPYRYLLRNFKRNSSSFICFNNDVHTLKKLKNLKKVELRKSKEGSSNEKIDIFIDDKKLLTHKKNDFSFEKYDLCFLIKLELLRNKNTMNLLHMPILITANNLIDFIHTEDTTKEPTHEEETKEKETVETYERKYKGRNHYIEKPHHIIQDELDEKANLHECKTDRKIIESKLMEYFKNDLILYNNADKNELISDSSKRISKSIDLPSSLNYIGSYKIRNLYEEEKYVYDKYITLFEQIHQIKIQRATNFETPIQNKHTEGKIYEIIKNMKNSEIFIFYKCTQLLHSFIFTYLFLNGTLSYKEVYRYCNLEYVYQFSKWGYVYDINIMKDANALLTLSVLFLIDTILHTNQTKTPLPYS